MVPCLKNYSVLSVPALSEVEGSSVAILSISSLWHRIYRSTLVKRPLQIHLFLQNKPNLVRRRRIASAVMTRRYDNIMILSTQKTNPIQTQFLPAEDGVEGGQTQSNPNLYRLGNLGNYAERSTSRLLSYAELAEDIIQDFLVDMLAFKACQRFA
jgi:hypothetical protein